MANTDTQAVVHFTSNGVGCIAGMGSGVRTINFRVCVMTLGDKQEFSFSILPGGLARCSVTGLDESTIWFDTDESSAKQISDLFQSTSIQ